MLGINLGGARADPALLSASSLSLKTVFTHLPLEHFFDMSH